MVYKNKIHKLIKRLCVKKKIYLLENKKRNIIQSFIENNPSSAAKSDNIELRINQENFSEINLKIKILKRFQKKINS